MFERDNDRPGSRRWIRAVVIAAAAVAVASLAIVGTVAAQSRQSFDDVPPGHEHFEAIEWAVANGITRGCDRTGRDFCPDRTLSRGHTVRFLKNYHDKFHGGTVSNPSTTTTAPTPSEYVVAGYGSDFEWINLTAGTYRASFTLLHDDDLEEFDEIKLTVEDSRSNDENLCLEDTTESNQNSDYSNVRTYTCRATFEVGARLGQLDPGRIYFVVSIKDNTTKTGNRVAYAEWEVIVTER